MNKIVVGGNILEKGHASRISEIPQNKTLYVDQFTGKKPDFASEREVFAPHNLSDVFSHYKPSVNNIELSSQEETVFEDFNFENLDDFDDEKLIEKSAFLKSCKSRIDVYNSAIINLQHNRNLKEIMQDKDSKSNLIEILDVLLQELKETK